jgi:hypothetical protein
MSTAKLESQVALLMEELETMRAEKKIADQIAGEKIAALEAKVNGTPAPKTQSKTPTKSPAAKKTTPAKADSVSGSVTDTPQGSATPKKYAGKKEASPEKPQSIDTTAQHAWDKFCSVARNEFTIRELSLVSHNTLRDLMVHYNIVNAVECAQIECQWALMQEGKEAVANPTPQPTRASGRAKPFKPIEPEQPFDIKWNIRKPHLSARTINQEAIVGTNPNNLKMRKADPVVSKHVGHVDPAAPCDPNLSPRRAKFAAPGRKFIDGQTMKMRADARAVRGKNRSSSPNPTSLTPYPEGAAAAGSIRRIVDRAPSVDHVERGKKTIGYVAKAEPKARLSLKPAPASAGAYTKNTFKIG